MKILIQPLKVIRLYIGMSFEKSRHKIFEITPPIGPGVSSIRLIIDIIYSFGVQKLAVLAIEIIQEIVISDRDIIQLRRIGKLSGYLPFKSRIGRFVHSSAIPSHGSGKETHISEIVRLKQ